MKMLIKSALERKVPEPPQQEEISPDDKELREIIEGLRLSIKVVGCGGGGSNTITRLSNDGIVGAELIACNTDARHLLVTHANRKILLGRKITRGLGAGGDPRMGEQAAKEADEELEKVLHGAHITFITCGLGGGTGTGSAPYVAEIAKKQGSLVMAFATKPFSGEGKMRMENAEEGMRRLSAVADTVVTISNDKLLEMVPKLPINDAFKVLDELLMHSIKAIVELVTKPGLVNLDFNDLRTIVEGGGVSVMGIGDSDAPISERVDEAVNKVLTCPLLEYDISGATGALVKITGGPDMTIAEAERAVELIQKKVSPTTRLIWGAAVEPEMEGRVRVMLVVTGVSSPQIYGKGGPTPPSYGLDDIDMVR